MLSTGSVHFTNNKRGKRSLPFGGAVWVALAVFLLLAADMGAASPLDDYFSSPRIPRAEIHLTGQNSPDWMKLWRDARAFATAGEYSAARVAYSRLLEMKGDALLARWELASLLLARDEFDQAAALLEMLLEENPEGVDYLNGLGYAMQKKRHYGRAVELFDRAAGIDPANIVALTGLGEGLLALGNLGKALPKLEALNARRVDDVDLQKRLVGLYLNMRLAAKARPLAVRLAESRDATVTDFKMAAKAHDEPGLREIAAGYWRKVVAAAPGDAEGHAWLASHLEEEGNFSEALPHLLFLLKRDPDDGDLLVRAAACSFQNGEEKQAALYYERYLALFPHDKDVIRRLVDIYAELGREGDTLAALDRYFTVEPDPAPGKLREAALLYDAAGRFHDAIPIYRRLLEINPDDSEILAILARDLLAIGEDDGALKIWAHLARISSDSKAIYRSMMELLLRLDRQDELVYVLKEINRLDPDDIEVALRLAAALLASREIKEAEKVFLPVATREITNIDLLRMRAEIFENLRMPDHALRDYAAITKDGRADSPQLRVKCLELAASMGRLKMAYGYLDGFLAADPAVEDILRVADGFREGFVYETAHSLYQAALERATEPALRQRILVSFARSYARQDLVFEAEQVLRIALLENPADMLMPAQLADLHLQAGHRGEAAIWLDQLESEEVLAGVIEEKLRESRWVGALLRARLLNASGKYSAAQRKLRTLIKEMGEVATAGEVVFQGKKLAYLAGLEQVRASIGLEEYDEAERQCRAVKSRDIDGLDCLVALQQIALARGDSAAAEAWFDHALDAAGRDLGRVFRLVDAYRAAGITRAYLRSAEAASTMAPDSFAALFLQAKAFFIAGEQQQALTALKKLEGDYPAISDIESLKARAAFTLGLDDEALAYCDLVLNRQPYRADMQLLKARIYWRQLDWGESINVYENYLIPPVEDLLAEKAELKGVELPAEEKSTLWQRLTFSSGKQEPFVVRAMSPSFVVKGENAQLNELAVPLYSRYKWQQRFSVELAARRFVEQRDDLRAINLLEQLVEKYPEDESLVFDLAGIYSRLDQLGDEAQLYERLARLNPLYPGLGEALERNRLKRLPRIIAGSRYQTEDGRDGYKSIRKNAVDIGAWASPHPGNDVDLTLSRIIYSSADAEDTVRAKRVFASYEKNIFSRFDINLGGGVESLDGHYADTALVECALTGKVTDRVQGEVRYERDVVEDTVASLSRNIVAENVQAGLLLGLLPRLQTGGNYDYTNYSDGNDMKGYSFWASYILLPEPTYLQFKFSYDFQDSREGGNMPGVLLDDGFTDNDHPYWTPRNYWKNGYSVLWKHKLSSDTLERGTPSYYSGEYLVEYDSNGHMIQTFRGLFFLELSRNWMLESGARLVLSDGYRAKDFTLSAIYRW